MLKKLKRNLSRIIHKDGENVNNDLNGLIMKIRGLKKIQLEMCSKMMKAYNSTLYPMDLLAMGAIKRSLFLNRGFCDLIESRNLHCAAPILRMQLDNSLRFYAAFIVKEPHKYASSILDGEEVRNLRDRNNKKMTDRYLVSQLSKEYKWVESVYDETCAFVHLSNKHIFNTMKKIDNKTRIVNCSISDFDFDISEGRYNEAAEAFIEITEIFNRYLDGWIFTKDNPEVVKEIAKRQNYN